MSEQMRRWIGLCNEGKCAISVTVEVGPDSPLDGIPKPAEWVESISWCPVCDEGDIEWDWGEPETSWEESR